MPKVIWITPWVWQKIGPREQAYKIRRTGGIPPRLLVLAGPDRGQEERTSGQHGITFARPGTAGFRKVAPIDDDIAEADVLSGPRLLEKFLQFLRHGVGHAAVDRMGMRGLHGYIFRHIRGFIDGLNVLEVNDEERRA